MHPRRLLLRADVLFYVGIYLCVTQILLEYYEKVVFIVRKSENVQTPSERNVIHHHPSFTDETQKRRKQEEILFHVLKIYQVENGVTNQNRNEED